MKSTIPSYEIYYTARYRSYWYEPALFQSIFDFRPPLYVTLAQFTPWDDIQILETIFRSDPFYVEMVGGSLRVANFPLGERPEMGDYKRRNLIFKN